MMLQVDKTPTALCYHFPMASRLCVDIHDGGKNQAHQYPVRAAMFDTRQAKIK